MKVRFQTGNLGPRKPDWFRIKHIGNLNSVHVGSLMERYNLHSVCQSAHCPNRSECWSLGTATFMVMGEYCTRGCRFCSVKSMARPPPLDPQEPEHLAEAVSSLNLKYIVITSVARDDLEDDGAGHIAECIKAIKKRQPSLIVEALIPDLKAKRFAIEKIVESRADVISHNIETVERLTRQIRDIRANYRQSIEMLRLVSEISGGRIITKSGMMVGLGEKEEEVRQAMDDLRGIGVEIFTIGQYLRPTNGPRHVEVKEWIHPDTFKRYEQMGYEVGFSYMACGPMVRSSYKAGEPFITKLIQSRIR